jgi:hypothetical protein
MPLILKCVQSLHPLFRFSSLRNPMLMMFAQALFARPFMLGDDILVRLVCNHPQIGHSEKKRGGQNES